MVAAFVALTSVSCNETGNSNYATHGAYVRVIGTSPVTYHTDEEFLGAVLTAEGLVEGEMGPYGLMISAVDGEEAVWEVNNAYWALYVGEEYATSGADTTPVYDGSAFKLEYTIG